MPAENVEWALKPIEILVSMPLSEEEEEGKKKTKKKINEEMFCTIVILQGVQ